MKARADKSEKSRCLIYLVCSNKQLHPSGETQLIDVWEHYATSLWGDRGPVWVEFAGYNDRLPRSFGTMLFNKRPLSEGVPSGAVQMANHFRTADEQRRVTYSYECKECPKPRINAKVTYERLAMILDGVQELGGDVLELSTLQRVMTSLPSRNNPS